MHELGHNFNSDHTHSYSPVIDTCGSSCPAQLPLAKSATIMSYCDQCGGYSNIEYTFGGKYSGTGLRSDMNSYSNSPLAGLGIVSIEPRRVKSRGESVLSSLIRVNCIVYLSNTFSLLVCHFLSHLLRQSVQGIPHPSQRHQSPQCLA